MNKPTIWIFSIEPIETRYTKQWQEHIPSLLNKQLGDKFNVVQVNGIQKDSQLTPGAFLNFSDTNYWKSSQLCNFLEYHNRGETSTNDHILYTDFWNPTVIQIKYMKELLGFNWTLHGLVHAGSYDSEDFLGRLVGNKPWVRNTEKSFYHAFNHNYFATEFHVKMFIDELLHNGCPSENPWYEDEFSERYDSGKIVRSGWPMEYMVDILAPYKDIPKRDLILFPHRIAPEKQVEIFRDLALQLPQYEFVVCQDQKLNKHEYHTLLGQSKIVFSANLQETLGISLFEGAIVDAIPFAPDRLSYSEMYLEEFKYPCEWTESYETYTQHKTELCALIIKTMSNYDTLIPKVRAQVTALTSEYFSATNILKNIK